jgi:16S rRNA (uracil1498-N3)-methyltransferase
MNLILLFPDDFIEGTDRVRLTGRRRDHVLKVHRAAAGDELCVGLVNDRIGTGKVIALSEDVLEMDVSFDRPAPVALPLTLALALPRPKVLRRVVRSATAMGVKKIILLNSFRVEKSYWQSPFLNEESMREQAVLGLEQARDTVLPNVELRPLFRPFVEDELPGIIKSTLALVAHPHANEACPRNVTGPVTLVIGPEGGFIQYELDKLIEAGCRTVSAGERILSVETAVPALIARLF